MQTCCRAQNKDGYDQKNEPMICLPSGVHTKPKPKTNPKTSSKTNPNPNSNPNPTPTLNLVIFRVRVRVRVRFSGVLRWAKISLAYFFGRTRCPPVTVKVFQPDLE